MFRKYDHVERLGHEDVDNILFGDVYIFPKLDGTNASVWCEPDGSNYMSIHAGSRTREINHEADNAGFHAWVNLKDNYTKFGEILSQNPNWIIYGEWLVPHTLKTYRNEAWRRFWVFDVYDRDKQQYVHYEQWEPTIRGAGLDVIDPMIIYTNPLAEQIAAEVEKNTYLVSDGAGLGEGVVIKNYAWANNFGRQPWAKLVRNEFKEENKRAFGLEVSTGLFQVEVAIAEKYVTNHLVNKTRAKVRRSYYTDEFSSNLYADVTGDEYDAVVDAMDKRTEETHRSEIIPRLLETVFNAIIHEELWTALKEHKFPVIDFKKLRTCCIIQTKKHAQDLF